jgi:hypothetical protein
MIDFYKLAKNERLIFVSSRADEIEAADRLGLETWVAYWGPSQEHGKSNCGMQFANVDQLTRKIRDTVGVPKQPSGASLDGEKGLELPSRACGKIGIGPIRDLEYAGKLDAVYALGYRIPKKYEDRRDLFSQIVDRGKIGYLDDVKCAVDCMKCFAESLTVGGNEKPVVIPLISHGELVANPRCLAFKLAIVVAEALKGRLCLDVLSKGIHGKLQKLGRDARLNAVKGKYKATPNDTEMNDAKVIYLVDDVVTTGATSGDAARALLEEYPEAKVVLLTLARAWNDRYQDRVNDFPPSITSILKSLYGGSGGH